MSVIDETHDPRRESWVASARGHAEFPIQNLPFGIFSPAGGSPRGGVAIGDAVFDRDLFADRDQMHEDLRVRVALEDRPVLLELCP